MVMRSGRITRTHNLRLLVFFGILVAILVISSLVLKFISLARESRFDGEHFFVVSFLRSEQADIVGFDPKTRTIVLLHTTGNAKRSSLKQTLGIPIDGEVYGEAVSDHSIPSTLLRIFFRYQMMQTDLTIIDIGRLAFFAKTVSQSDIAEKALSLSKDEASIENIVASMFIDPAIKEEKLDVEIVNASGVSGLGQRLERVLSHIGGNVVAVTTSPKIMSVSSIVYFGKKTYTLSKMQRIIDIPISYTEKPRLADITIVLGEDIVKTKQF